MMKRPLGLIAVAVAVLGAGCGDEQAGQQPDADQELSESGAPAGTPVAEPRLEREPDTVESLAGEFLAQLDDLAEALREVEDVKSAQKVAEIMPLACGQFQGIATRLKYLDVPSDEVKERINEQMEQREKEMARSLGDQEDFLNTLDPAAREIVQDSMERFIATMEGIQPIMERYFLVSEESSTPPPAPPEIGAPADVVPDPIPPVTPVPDPNEDEEEGSDVSPLPTEPGAG